MSVGVSNVRSKSVDRAIRMRDLISHEQYRSAVQGSGWSLLDRFLYRGMRALLFNRDLEVLRQAAKRALLRELEAGSELNEGPMAYFRIECTIWSLRLKSTAFVAGLNVDPAASLDLLMATGKG